MSTSPYPNLGFNPVPGLPDDVAGLRNQIKTAADAVTETNGLLNRLRNSNDGVWKGNAGEAFRAHFDVTLAQDLGYAQNSLERAVRLIEQWHANLVGYRDIANGLELEAADARGRHARAVVDLQRAQVNPDLGLANMQFSDPVQLQAAQARLDAAVMQVRTTTASVDDWQGRIDSILRRAYDLEGEHNNTARRIAAELDAAGRDFAPRPPDKSIWDRISDAVKAVGKWIDEHREGIHQTLSIIAAIGGLVAVLTPPPFNIIGFAVGAAATAGLLTLDLSDPTLRDGLMNGELDAWTRVGLDSLGLAPIGGGAAAAGKVGWGLLRGSDAVADGAHAAQSLGAFERVGGAVYQAVTHEPGIVAKGLAKVPGVSNTVEALNLNGATRTVLQVTGVAGARAEVATTAEVVDLFLRSNKLTTSLSHPLLDGDH
ncbi:hypothetical protein ACL02S_08730 [Nocardia sp. 004]|uniref:hypothetical protein n=1 Tax=Nocardia sp. 004 TaxID=3385978 RepID=UPI0039A29DA2